MDQLNQFLIAELKRESINTRKILACVPEDKIEWQPHEKSMTLGRLASHVAEMPFWVNRVLEADEFDMAAVPPNNRVIPTNKELLEFFEARLEHAVALLGAATNEKLAESWLFRRGDFVISNNSRYETIRFMMMNHQVHHRGQLSVYLRLLNIPIPGMYGPSADDRAAMAKAQQVTQG